MRRLRFATALLLAAVVGYVTPTAWAAITGVRTNEVAIQARDLCAEGADYQARVAKFLAYNNSTSINWGALEANDPGVDAEGLIDGQSFTPDEVSNAIGSLDALNTLLVGSGHLGNFHKLASP